MQINYKLQKVQDFNNLDLLRIRKKNKKKS